ncbi:hypothetical protein A2837_00850 [Candidatus Kaiserbacteria bacterium RIFCSPHIGHO2_01_FULL_46_22]|uniref:Peptidase M14 domain-containing protein n=1 Tax=Candidatus Kaiserbacteria bacterium RIFCSPHIGHO2_01_FULL_46_22 TaxID=1798475 RepID=A0A1F6BXV8_9BACT|nr:MAG: hypothetical protein A2837_00850 [Candidatus Kaiserbacteria bacterium RIFCSPHIGHO2_01_FULL_46_22]
MKYLVIAVVVILVLGVGGFFVYKNIANRADMENDRAFEEAKPDTAAEQEKTVDDTKTVIGKSADGHEITAYHYGKGDTNLLFIGGIHGGYSWNTALVAYELMEYLEKTPDAIPENMRVTVIPVMNPDGLNTVVGTTSRFSMADVPEESADTIPGRFNSNEVDLNRNFDCDWQAESKWQNRTVSGGSEAFSEPESKAVRDFIATSSPDAVVVWYSSAGGVFASNCHDGVLAETTELTSLYAEASGYRAFKEFNFYEITGDMVNWMAKQGIPAISVLLTTHRDVEWNKNRAGIEALFKHYSDESADLPE